MAENAAREAEEVRNAAVEEREAAVSEAKITRETMEVTRDIVGVTFDGLGRYADLIHVTFFLAYMLCLLPVLILFSPECTAIFLVVFCLQRGKKEAESVKKQLHDLVQADETRLATNKGVATEVRSSRSLLASVLIGRELILPFHFVARVIQRPVSLVNNACSKGTADLRPFFSAFVKAWGSQHECPPSPCECWAYLTRAGDVRRLYRRSGHHDNLFVPGTYDASASETPGLKKRPRERWTGSTRPEGPS